MNLMVVLVVFSSIAWKLMAFLVIWTGLIIFLLKLASFLAFHMAHQFLLVHPYAQSRSPKKTLNSLKNAFLMFILWNLGGLSICLLAKWSAIFLWWRGALTCKTPALLRSVSNRILNKKHTKIIKLKTS